MYIETDRLIIRDMQVSDEPAYVDMASDGSLDEDIFAGCSTKYHEWMCGWIAETKMYKDVTDIAEKLYNFYEMQKSNCDSIADTN